MVDIILAARRYANGEVQDFLRDRGFLIKVPPSWRELHPNWAESCRALVLPARRWEEIEQAGSVGVVPLGVGEVGGH